MSVLLAQLLSHTPVIVGRQALVQLFRATAAAFQADMPRLSGLSREQCLQAYARFTAEQAEAALRQGDDLPGLQARLYENAYRLGRLPGRLLRVQGVDDTMTLGRFLYGILDIDFEGSANGEIMIDRCYFSGCKGSAIYLCGGIGMPNNSISNTEIENNWSGRDNEEPQIDRTDAVQLRTSVAKSLPEHG